LWDASFYFCLIWFGVSFHAKTQSRKDAPLNINCRIYVAARFSRRSEIKTPGLKNFYCIFLPQTTANKLAIISRKDAKLQRRTAEY